MKKGENEKTMETIHNAINYAILQLSPASFFAASAIVACLGVFPTSSFAIAAGALYGFPAGLALYVGSTALGAALCFFLIQTSLRDLIFRIFIKNYIDYYEKITRAVKSEGSLYITILIRLSPVMPYTPASFILALVDVPIFEFVLGTMIGLIPSSAPYVYMGSIGSSTSSDEWDFQSIAMALSGAIGTLLLTWKVSKVVNRALNHDGASIKKA